MALGSSCFGLLFLGSGSTFGSTSPPFSARQSAPFPVLILWVANPKGISWSLPRHSPGQRITADLSFGLPVAAFPASSVRPTSRSWPRKCVARKTQQPRPFPYWGFGDGVCFSKEGDNILGLTGQSGESRRQKALFYRLLHGLFTTSGGGSGVILFQVRFV